MRCTQRTILASFSLSLIICLSQAFAAEHDVTRDEMRALLKERDAAIIQLQHTVKDLMARLEVVELSIDPSLPTPSPPDQLSDDDSARAEVQQGFAKLEVDEQAAQRALERTLIQGGALLLPAWRTEFGPSFIYALNQIDFPAIVSDGDEMLLSSNNLERTALTINLDVRVGLPFDSQLELGLPYQWADEEITTRIQGVSFGQSSSRSGSGIGSLKVGLAKTFVRERGWRPDVVGRITWDTGSGDRIDNGVFLGGFESIGGSLTFIKRHDPLVFFGSASYRTFLKEDDIEPGNQFAFSFGTALAVSPASSLFASISNQFLAETEFDNEQIDGSNITSVTLSLGASTIVSRGFLLNLTTGIGISEDAPDYSIGLSASVQTDALRDFLYRY
jgi:hypothetical protein